MFKCKQLMATTNKKEIRNLAKIEDFTDFDCHFKNILEFLGPRPESFFKINSHIFWVHHCLGPYPYVWSPNERNSDLRQNPPPPDPHPK